MKPKTKFQKRVFEASQMLPAITEAQAGWAYRECLEHVGRRLKTGLITCLDCGHSWIDKTSEKHCTCPNCGTALNIRDTKKRVFHDYGYLCVITVSGDLQVLRFIYVNSTGRIGKRASYFHSEVVQRWMASDGKHGVIAKLRPMMYYGDSWNFGSKLEIRPERPVHNIIPTHIYPNMRMTSELRRSGFDGKFYSIPLFDLFRALLSNSRAETLLKAGQAGLLKHFTDRNFRNMDDYWASIKICIRNSYLIQDGTMWCDYINLLRFFGKDLHNAKFVCPADLQSEHDRYVRKKREWQERQRREEAKRKAMKDEAHFNEQKSRFFGIQFTDGLIHVHVLESIAEIIQEGDAMRHCVSASEYHLRPDSLILSARIDDRRIETVELSLSQLKILQSRGVCNQVTEYHKQIIKLVNKNRLLFKRRRTA